MKLQRRCEFFKNTSILADKNSSRQLYKNLTQILVFYKTFYTFEKWFSQLNFYPIPLNTFWAEKSSQLCRSEEDFQSFMSPTTSILVGKLPSLQNVCFYTFVRSPYGIPTWPKSAVVGSAPPTFRNLSQKGIPLPLRLLSRKHWKKWFIQFWAMEGRKQTSYSTI